MKKILRRIRDRFFDWLLRPYLIEVLENRLFKPGSSLEQYLRRFLTYQYLVFGDPARLQIASTCDLNNAMLNTVSGSILIEDYVFFGHNVSVLTGTHDLTRFDRERMETTPPSGRDIIIRRGVWIASNATVLGPCVIGEHAVIAAGALVTGDIPPYAVAAGVPARVIRLLEPQDKL